MEKEQQERALILLQATLDILKTCESHPFVVDVFETTAIWDEVECDGNCLMEEIEQLINDI